MNAFREKPASSGRPLLNLIRRLHFYIGLFIAPFIFIAALTGVLYVATPQIEQMLYRDSLQVTPQGKPHSLAEQIAVARQMVGQEVPIFAVRPAPEAQSTTRVQFSQPGLGASESRAIFIDPYRLQVVGDHKVYGTSGILPFRTQLDHLHQSLLLGSVGRLYSELAASWMWVAALGGLVLWLAKRPAKVLAAQPQAEKSRRWHGTLGLVLLIGMLFLSVTGITWSQWAGQRVASLRSTMDWMTPQVNRWLTPQSAPRVTNAHAEHQASPATDHDAMPGMVMSQPKANTVNRPNGDWDRALQAARQAGIDAERIELRQPGSAKQGWTVNEIDQRWPLRVDAVAIDPHNFEVMDKVVFAQYSLAAKLTRWGVSAHMGVLFGWINQLLLALFGLGLCVMVVLGYRLWWQRRPAASLQTPMETLYASWLAQPLGWRVITLLLGASLGYALPLLGISLTLFIAIDLLRTRRARRLVRLAESYPEHRLPEAIWQRERHKGHFMRAVVVLWLVTSVVMTRAIIGGVIDEYQIGLSQWSSSMYLMQGMMVMLYTSVFTALMSVPLWYFFVGTEEE